MLYDGPGSLSFCYWCFFFDLHILDYVHFVLFHCLELPRILTTFFLYFNGIFSFTARLNNSSEGGTHLVEPGVVRYCKRKRFSSCFNGFSSSRAAVLSASPNGCINRSTVALS